MLSKLAVRRLTKLADYMERLPKSAEKHFDMESWFFHDGDNHRHKFGDYITRRDLKHCGTTACAMGWASTMPYFRKLGVKVSPYGDLSKFPSEIFGNEASHLFSGVRKDRTPKKWAKSVRKFLRDNT